MLIITTQAEMKAVLASPIDDTVKRILLLRGDLIDLATFVIPEPGDTITDIDRTLGMSAADDHEWVLDHATGRRTRSCRENGRADRQAPVAAP